MDHVKALLLCLIISGFVFSILYLAVMYTDYFFGTMIVLGVSAFLWGFYMSMLDLVRSLSDDSEETEEQDNE